MDYGAVLSRAWGITWKYKAIWLFAVILSLPAYLISWLQNLLEQSAGNSLDSTLYLCGYSIFAVVFSLVLAVYQSVGLIRGIYKAEAEAPDKLTVQEIFRQVPPRFWKMTGFYLLLYLAILLVVGVLVIPFALIMANSDSGMGFSLLGIGLICIMFPLLLVLGLISNQMMIALLVDDLSIGDAVRKGWDVVRKNFGTYLVISLIVIAIGIGFLIIVSIPYFGILFAYLGNMFASDTLIPGAFARQTPWFIILVSIVVALLGLFVSIFSMSVYVLTYLKLTDRPGTGHEGPPAVEQIGMEPA